MTVLNIFSLDDTEQQNVIACLSEGKHVIGRGGLLKVTDKRVSRKHAVIEVSNDKVTITSAHVNPCFFKAVNGRTLMVITQNQENELNDGDQFSLLPEDYWFKVKIKKEVPEEPHINGKRCLEETRESNNVDSKRLRLSINSNESDEVNIEDGPTISNITENTLDNSSNIDTSHNSQCKQETNSEENNDEESISSLQFQETARIEDIERENASTQVKEEPTDKIELTNDNISIQVADENIKEEPQDSIAGDTPQNANNTADNKANTVIKKANNDNGNRDGATGSADPPTAPTAIRREKCWYGARCFRKNPNHRISFSHPGDQDYDDADADDDSPDCPYGIACYRKNPDHRKEYKHKAGPAPKPSNVNVTLRVSDSCAYCEHCNRKWGGGKDDYESDVDEN